MSEFEDTAETVLEIAKRDREIETLRARVVELEDKRAYENLIKYGNSHPEMYKTELDLVKEQLAASQAENARLREALEESKRWVYTNGGWVRKAETGESK